MSLMAVCARYGNVQPSEFADMSYLEAHELGRRVIELHNAEMESMGNLHVELVKVILKALGARGGL
jgi:hypothetical protein